MWGGDAACAHEWGDEQPGGEAYKGRNRWQQGIVGDGRPKERGENYQRELRASGELAKGNASQGAFCRKCNAWRGDLGLEPTPEMYVEHIVEVFRGAKRVLRDDGVCFLNLGDCYAANMSSDRRMHQPTRDTDRSGGVATQRTPQIREQRTATSGLKPKDLCGMPWRVAFALQQPWLTCKGCETENHASQWARFPNGRWICPACEKSCGHTITEPGWYLRSALPWIKRSAMPESATDRPTSALEYVFLLTKQPRYFWDAEAVRQKAQYGRREVKGEKIWASAVNDMKNRRVTQSVSGANPSSGRSFRNTDLYFASLRPPHGMILCGDEPVGLDVNPEAFKAAHFATFPRKLVTPLIKAGTSEKGCCPECGKPWQRVIESEKLKRPRPNDRTTRHKQGGGVNSCGNTVAGVANKTIGWRQSCECCTRTEVVGGYTACAHQDGEPCSPPAPTPCVVLDICCGSGTVGVVARQLGRSFIGHELSPEYAEMARKRIANPEPEPVVEDVEGQMEMDFDDQT